MGHLNVINVDLVLVTIYDLEDIRQQDSCWSLTTLSEYESHSSNVDA